MEQRAWPEEGRDSESREHMATESTQLESQRHEATPGAVTSDPPREVLA
jgi:hypothetical protein